ncbi:helix-turn-helix domain-containing protein [Caballeronia sp. LP003]|uniref:helix-turn-helix domain-containing protein n=1 Tax=Caballeronia sp. LP003 TaxID=3038551 RepID=UPI00285F2DB0|nr:helix-turn-helix domain-containing protein [Caballeronia sp. LP003]MDR5785210.1 helix-turn-helix domain-containing protein [Caballeronia sp. LP003]
MTIFVLIRDEDEVRRQCAMRSMDSLHLDVRDEDVFVGQALPTTPALERPVLQHVISRLWPEDLLVVFDLASLGNGYADVLSTLQTIQAKKAAVACICTAVAETALIRGETLIETLLLVMELDHRLRALRASEAAQQMKRDGTRMGRPSSLGPDLRRKALEALAAGNTVTEVARLLSTSRQTILRLQAAKRKE